MFGSARSVDPGRLGRLNIQRIAFNRREPICLATPRTLPPFADNGVSPIVVDQVVDRLAALRQFIDDRAVQIAVSNHR